MGFYENLQSFFKNTFRNKESAVFRDLTLNLEKTLSKMTSFELKEIVIVISALSKALEWSDLQKFCYQEMKSIEMTETQIEECFDIAAMMAMLNTYYKFKDFLSTDSASDPAYLRTGLRIGSISNPINGPLYFEMMAFSISVMNGCASCIGAHEKKLVSMEITREKIHELVRLTAILKGLYCLQS